MATALCNNWPIMYILWGQTRGCHLTSGGLHPLVHLTPPSAWIKHWFRLWNMIPSDSFHMTTTTTMIRNWWVFCNRISIHTLLSLIRCPHTARQHYALQSVCPSLCLSIYVFLSLSVNPVCVWTQKLESGRKFKASNRNSRYYAISRSSLVSNVKTTKICLTIRSSNK